MNLTSRILPLLNEYIPEEMALRGISKISPKMGSFLQNGLAAGLPLSAGLNFIREKLSKSPKSKMDKTLRPDEQSSQSRIEANERQNEGIKTVAKLGAGAVAGGLGSALASSVLSGNPKTQNSLSQMPAQQQNAAPKQGNIIQQYDDVLHAFIDSEIKKG